MCQETSIGTLLGIEVIGPMDHLVLTVEGDRQCMTDRLFLEDLHVGQRLTSASHVVDADQIKRFAAEFDPQPFHLDEDAAANSIFAGLVGSGWHTAALTMRLLLTGGVSIAGGIVGAGGEIAWPRPTRPGDELQVVSEVTEIRPSRTQSDKGIVVLRNETRNQRGEVVQVLTAKLVVPRKPQASAPSSNRTREDVTCERSALSLPGNRHD
jgi:acyl dehydratase